jgi:hypothetical protein
MTMKRILLTLVAAAIVAVGAPTSFAASHAHNGDPGCSITPSDSSVGATYTVSAWGLPIGTAVNLWVTAPDGTTSGSPLGSTPDGTFNMNESSASAGLWTYVFAGPVKQHTQVYATCWVEAY